MATLCRAIVVCVASLVLFSSAMAYEPDFSRNEWQQASASTIKLVRNASPIDRALRIDGGAAVEQLALPFYKSVDLVRVTHDSIAAGTAIYFLSDGRRLTRLDGTSPPIHRFNRTHDLRWSSANAANYLWFFTYFVRGEEGPFLIVTSKHSGNLPHPFDMKSADRRAVEAAAKPISCTRGTSKFAYECSANLIYSDHVFRARFGLERSGMITMIDDQPAATLSFTVDAPIKVAARADPAPRQTLAPSVPDTPPSQCATLRSRSSALKGEMAQLVVKNPGVHALGAACGALGSQVDGQGEQIATFLACSAAACWLLDVPNCLGVAQSWADIAQRQSRVNADLGRAGC